MKLGRTTIGEPYATDAVGDSLSFSSRFGFASYEEAEATRGQLLGLQSGDVIPLTGSTSRSLPSGFYRIRGVRVSPAGRRWRGEFMIVADVDLARVGGFGSALVETRAVSSVRTNTFGAADDECYTVVQWAPNDTPSIGARPSGTVLDTREAEGGQILCQLRYANATHEAMANYIAPEAYYVGAAKLERRCDDGVWRPVVGKQADAGSLAGRWRISNGLVRFTPSTANEGDLKVESWSASTNQWVAATTELRFGQDGGGGGGASFQQNAIDGGFFVGYNYATSAQEPINPVITENTRDLVTLTFPRHEGGWQTLSLAAADLFAEFRSLVNGATGPAAIEGRTSWSSDPIPAGSIFSFQPGQYEDADDANGNRLVIIQTDYIIGGTYGSANGGIYINSTEDLTSWGIGVEIDGSSATDYNDVTEIAAQWIGAKGRSDRIVVA